MKKKIVLINLPAYFYSIHMPYSLLWLASYINKVSEYEASIIDLKDHFGLNATKESFFRKIISVLNEVKPEYVGFSCFTPDYHFVMELAEAIKKNLNTKILVGNVHASLFPEDFIFEKSPIDYTIIGEGEITLQELLYALDNDIDLNQVNGIAYFNKTEGFIRTTPRMLVPDLEIFSLPDYKLLPMVSYVQPSLILIRRMPVKGIAIYAGRGCPYKCIFCAANSIWKCNKGKPVRFRKPATIIKEIELLKDTYGIDGFYFMDDTFTAKRDNVLEFCDRVKKLNLIWGCCARINEVNEEMIAAMRKTGCLQFDLGIESGSAEMLKTIKKGIKVEQIIDAIELCKKNDIRVFANMMVNLPGERLLDIDDSVRLLKQTKPSRVAVAVATPLPATELHDKFLKQKLKPKDYELLRFRKEQDERFKMSEHTLSSMDVYNRIDKVVKPFIPDYLKIFTNKTYITTMLQNKRLFSYFSMSLRTWIISIYFWRLVFKRFPNAFMKIWNLILIKLRIRYR